MEPLWKGRLFVRRIFPLLWITFIYFLVAATEGQAPSPPWGTWERVVFETWHTLVHAGAFAVQVMLTARAADDLRHAHARDGIFLILLGTLLGLGIEVLQWERRPDYVFVEGAWDMLSDFVGAAAGWFIYTRRLKLERNPVQP